ncbi:28S rRNA (cytosine-C(5))-methyltransferase [Palaemon carinicauda]|uniref:28S rRNA (cytosine-C(5))-methyltransferase n=1 Tax=Palaemon carinicauda TaxID=392227 RepID=UPI0035B64C23
MPIQKEQGEHGNGNQKGKKPHSVKVPQLYKTAAKILKKYENKEGSLKNLIYSENYRNYGTMNGLLHKLVANQASIKSAIAASNLLVEEPRFDPHLAQVFTVQVLAKGALTGDCKPIIVFKKYENKIKAIASNAFSAEKAIINKDPLPRYVRINTLMESVDQVHNQLATDGFILEDYDSSLESYDDFLERVKNLASPYYLIDYHIPELLVFPPGTQLWNSDLYKDNIIILQDKASCLPVFLSDIHEKSCVLDACAAPGNKTSYMAAKMKNKGRIIAIECNEKRFETMKKLLHFRKAVCVVSQNKDFYNLQPSNYPDVEHIFVDPSCSSSGTQVHNDEVSKERVMQLASVQQGLLRRALSFPSVKEVIYSTCSIHEEENEKVIEGMLSQYHKKFEIVNLATQLKGWKHFGHDTYSFGSKCLRTNVSVDRCTGFFIAKFVRKQENDGIKRKSITPEDSPDTTNAEKRSKKFKKLEPVNRDSNEIPVALADSKSDEQDSVKQETETSSDVKKKKKKRKSVDKVEKDCEEREVDSSKQGMEIIIEANESNSSEVKKKKKKRVSH